MVDWCSSSLTVQSLLWIHCLDFVLIWLLFSSFHCYFLSHLSRFIIVCLTASKILSIHPWLWQFYGIYQLNFYLCLCLDQVKIMDLSSSMLILLFYYLCLSQILRMVLALALMNVAWIVIIMQNLLYAAINFTVTIFEFLSEELNFIWFFMTDFIIFYGISILCLFIIDLSLLVVSF